MATERTYGEEAVLRARVAQLERELADQAALANAAVARAQDRSYWLDRWHLDLNQLMRRRGASETRAAVRAIRSVYRLLKHTRSTLRAEIAQGGDDLRNVRRTIAEERAAAERLAAAISKDEPSGR